MSPENTARLQTLKEAPLNSWVALTEDETKIVAVGTTYAEVVERSERAGVSDPIIMKTPPKWSSLSVIAL